jgi:solute carrier family 25 carnitine/acylcarnitine transporter 20/29
MQTHRYVRKHLVVDNHSDRYDLNLSNTGGRGIRTNAGSAAGSACATEYWTNGTTTLLHIPTQLATVAATTIAAPDANRSFPMTATTTLLPPKSNGTNHNSLSSQATLTPSAGNPTSRRGNSIRNSLLAGSAAGMASTIACHPFDVIRVKMQSSALATTASTAASAAPTTLAAGAASASASQQQPPGLVATVRSMIRLGGSRALYTGLAMPLAAQAVYKGTVFTVNNLTESAITEWKTQENYKLGIFTTHKLTMMDRFLSGFMGGAVNAALFCTPVEYVRNQQIVQLGGTGPTGTRNSSSGTGGKRLLGNPVSDGPISVIRRTIQTNGVAGLWRGTVSTVLRDSVGCGLFFVTIAYSQQLLTPPSQQSTPPTSVIVVSGAMAGVAYWVWALPIDTMKTWIQSGTASSLTNAWELSQRNGLVQGLHSLLRGWQVAYGRGAPSAAITVVTYSLAMRHLQEQQQEIGTT